MSRYSIGFPGPIIEKHFFKELSKLQKPRIVQIKKAIESLENNPRPQGKKFKFLRPPVSIMHLVATHRLRIGDYRILYDVDDKSKRVILLAIRRRSEKTYK